MLPELLVLAGLPLLALGALINGLWTGGEWLVKRIKQADVRRRDRIEAELDRQQAELRSTILDLAGALGMEAHEARKALIHESYLASGRLPEHP
jgi:hypothetical protein